MTQPRTFIWKSTKGWSRTQVRAVTHYFTIAWSILSVGTRVVRSYACVKRLVYLLPAARTRRMSSPTQSLASRRRRRVRENECFHVEKAFFIFFKKKTIKYRSSGGMGGTSCERRPPLFRADCRSRRAGDTACFFVSDAPPAHTRVYSGLGAHVGGLRCLRMNEARPMIYGAVVRTAAVSQRPARRIALRFHVYCKPRRRTSAFRLSKTRTAVNKNNDTAWYRP